MTTALTAGLRRVTDRLVPDDTPDGELLARFLAHRDDAAFAAIVRRHAAMVFGACRRVLGNAADADDAFQATFVVLVRRASAFTSRATVGNFLYGVAYHSALKAKAMAAKRRQRESAAAPPPAATDDAELLAALDEELARLPEKYREPVVLCELEGRPRREVAASLNVAEGTISSRLATAHRMLQSRLKARGFAVAGVAALLADRTVGASPALAEAAVHAALTGPTGGASQLVAEVSKMLFLSKLKLGAAVALGVTVLLTAGVTGFRSGNANAEDKPAAKAEASATKKEKTAHEKKVEAEQDEAKKFQGTWVSKKRSEYPERPLDGETVLWEWTFDSNGAKLVAKKGDQEKSSLLARYVLNPHAKPKELNIVGERSLFLCLYELDGDKLKVAMYARPEVDRPKSFDPKDNPKDADRLLVIEFERTDREPKAKLPKGVQDLYTLAHGEVVKLIPAPFPKERNKLLAELMPDAEPGVPFGWYVLTTDGKTLKVHRGQTSGPGAGAKVGQTVFDNSATLDHIVRSALQLSEQELFGLEDLDGTIAIDARFHMDVLIREGAPLEKLVPALQEQLKAKCKIDLKFTFTHEVTEAVKLIGEHKLNDPKRNVLDLYATKKVAPVPRALMTESSQIANALARFIGMPVVDESDLQTRKAPVKVNFHQQLPVTAETLKADRDPAAVLKHFVEQAGVNYVTVKRKVRLVRVEKPEAAAPKVEAPASQKDFYAAYALKEGEALKRIPPPFPAAREEFLTQTTKESIRDHKGLVFTYRMDGKKLEARGANNYYKKQPAMSLESLLSHAPSDCDLSRQEFECSKELLERSIPGEFVIRSGAKAEDFAPALERILRDELKWGVRVRVETLERDVIVASGSYHVGTALEAARKKLIVDKTGSKRPRAADDQRYGNLKACLDDLARYLQRRVFDDGVKSPKQFSWTYRHGSDPDPNLDLDGILDSIRDQTNLTLTKEKRKVRVISIVEDGK